MKSSFIFKAVWIVLLSFTFINLEAQKDHCNNFSKPKHKGRTSIYSVANPGENGQSTEAVKEKDNKQEIAIHRDGNSRQHLSKVSQQQQVKNEGTPKKHLRIVSAEKNTKKEDTSTLKKEDLKGVKSKIIKGDEPVPKIKRWQRKEKKECKRGFQ